MDVDVYSEASATGDFYALASIRFLFYNNGYQDALGWVQYTMSTSTYPLLVFLDDAKRSINNIISKGMTNYRLPITQLEDQIQLDNEIDSVRVQFLGYASRWPYHMEADVWFDNIVVKKGG